MHSFPMLRMALRPPHSLMPFLLALLTLIFMLSLPIPSAGAATPAAAQQFVDTLGKQVITVISQPGVSEEQKRSTLQQMFREHVDVPWMGKFVLGRYWQQANPEQRDRYMAAYQDYLLARYTTHFSDYNNSKYTITGVKDDGDGRYTVHMQIKSPQMSEETEAGYHLRADGDSFKIVDIIVEGVSLVTTQRSEFASVAQQKGVDGLIGDLTSKAQAERSDGAKS